MASEDQFDSAVAQLAMQIGRLDTTDASDTLYEDSSNASVPSLASMMSDVSMSDFDADQSCISSQSDSSSMSIDMVSPPTSPPSPPSSLRTEGSDATDESVAAWASTIHTPEQLQYLARDPIFASAPSGRSTRQ
ncbi:hypothetical protein K525DRAFT_274963 [Schizophyllum commune Loenen D]|nr:hypothetical protein K525DRAFT_274963 [Schizophyllum commune Loenen D]